MVRFRERWAGENGPGSSNPLSIANPGGPSRPCSAGTAGHIVIRAGGHPPTVGAPDQPSPKGNISHLPRDKYAVAMRENYVTGQTPWDSGVPSAELIRTNEEGDLRGRTILELGCGTGTNAIELARRGYQVTAVDLIDVPIQKARQKAEAAGVRVDFRAGDLTQIDLGGPYDCLFDIGLYHGIRNRNLPGFLSTLARVSRAGTRWLSVAGNAKEPLPEGPPVVTEAEFRSELEPLFEILRAREVRMNLRPDFQPLAWSILMVRR